ncbi:MAG: DNA-processing protein DprA, partial [Oscillospiraceae bacterium]
SDGYPERLKNIPSMPLAVYVKGDTEVFENIDALPAITVVGARKFSPYGRKVALTLSADLASIGFVIVSGLAIGIDAFSHTGAIKSSGKTIAVIGAGHDINYPKENSELRELIEENGCVVTEYAPDTPPHPKNFPMRNRIMTGISLGTLVVEAGEKSGTLITAGHALTQGKDVFAVPNDIFDENGRGTLRLIKDGAKAVSCATDIIEEYFWMYHDKITTNNMKDDYKIKGEKQKTNLACDISIRNNKNTKSADNSNYSNTISTIQQHKKKKSPPPYLTENQRLVFDGMTQTPKTIDEIANNTNLPMGELLSIITELEIYGLVVSHAGKRYSY